MSQIQSPGSACCSKETALQVNGSIARGRRWPFSTQSGGERINVIVSSQVIAWLFLTSHTLPAKPERPKLSPPDQSSEIDIASQRESLDGIQDRELQACVPTYCGALLRLWEDFASPASSIAALVPRGGLVQPLYRGLTASILCSQTWSFKRTIIAGWNIKKRYLLLSQRYARRHFKCHICQILNTGLLKAVCIDCIGLHRVNAVKVYVAPCAARVSPPWPHVQPALRPPCSSSGLHVGHTGQYSVPSEIDGFFLNAISVLNFAAEMLYTVLSLKLGWPGLYTSWPGMWSWRNMFIKLGGAVGRGAHVMHAASALRQHCHVEVFGKEVLGKSGFRRVSACVRLPRCSTGSRSSDCAVAPQNRIAPFSSRSSHSSDNTSSFPVKFLWGAKRPGV